MARERERIRGCWVGFCDLQRPRGDVVTGSNSKASFHRDGRPKNNRTEVSSLVDGEGLGLEDDEIGGLGGFEVLEDETPLGEGAPVLLTLVLGEEGHLGWGILVSLGNPGEDRATQACVASRSLPARCSVHLSGTLRELHHVVVLSLELLLVIVAVGFEVPDDLVKGLGSLAETIVVETLDFEGDDTRQDDVLFLDVQLLLGLLRVLLVSQDVAQLGAENLDGKSILVNLAGRRVFGKTGRFLLSWFSCSRSLFGWLFLGRRWWGRRRFLRGLGLGLRFHLLFLVFLYLLLVDFRLFFVSHDGVGLAEPV